MFLTFMCAHFTALRPPTPSRPRQASGELNIFERCDPDNPKLTSADLIIKKAVRGEGQGGEFRFMPMHQQEGVVAWGLGRNRMPLCPRA